MQESMQLVSRDVTRERSYGGHFRSYMRAEVCQMRGWLGGMGPFLWLLGRAEVGSALLKYDSKMSRKLQSSDWLVSVWSNTCWLCQTGARH